MIYIFFINKQVSLYNKKYFKGNKKFIFIVIIIYYGIGVDFVSFYNGGNLYVKILLCLGVWVMLIENI